MQSKKNYYLVLLRLRMLHDIRKDRGLVCEQLIWRAKFPNSTILHYKNFVRIHDCIYAMRDGQHSASTEIFSQCSLDV